MLRLVRKYAGMPLANRARRLAREFHRQTERADEVQRALLMSRIARNADSQFGRDHHFGEIHSPADFRRRVPVRGYDGHEPYIELVRRIPPVPEAITMQADPKVLFRVEGQWDRPGAFESVDG